MAVHLDRAFEVRLLLGALEGIGVEYSTVRVFIRHSFLSLS